MNGNKKKTIQLGMPYGTASNKLKKNLMFFFAKKCGFDNCYQCGSKIESVDELSVEHKVPWLDSENPIDLFFDVENIAFSHLKCNIGAGRFTEHSQKHIEDLREINTIKVKIGNRWCCTCKSEKPINKFSSNKSKRDDLEHSCIECRSIVRKRRRTSRKSNPKDGDGTCLENKRAERP